MSVSGYNLVEMKGILSKLADLISHPNPATNLTPPNSLETDDEWHPEENYSLSVVISRHEASTGTQKPLSFSYDEACPTCNGSGGMNQIRHCLTCSDRGKVVIEKGYFQVLTVCPECEGKLFEKICEQCSGDRTVTIEKNLKVKIPPNTTHHTTVRLQGVGPICEGVREDLLVTVEVEEM